MNGDGTGPNNHEIAAQNGYNVVTRQADAAALKAGAGKTLIIITHHLANLQCMDRIVFLENANIALDGSPAELERTSSRYRTLLAFDEAAFNRKATCERSE